MFSRLSLIVCTFSLLGEKRDGVSLIVLDALFWTRFGRIFPLPVYFYFVPPPSRSVRKERKERQKQTTQGRDGREKERKKTDNPREGWGGRHAATTQGF